MGIESRLVVPRGWGWKGMSSDYLMGMGFPGGDENVELRVVLFT